MKPTEFQAKLNGIICEVFTPYKEDNIWEIDHNALRQNIRFLIEKGIKVVSLADTGGELPLLTDDERKAVWKTVVEVAGGKLITIAASGHYSLKGALELTKYAEEIGVDGVVIIAPYYYIFDQDGLYQYYKTIAESTNLGIIVHNSPQHVKVNIAPALMEKLAQIPNVVGLKESGYDMERFYSTLTVMEKFHKPVLPGMEEICYLSGNVFSSASAGFFSLNANWWPQGMLALAKYIDNKNQLSAAEYLRKLKPYFALLSRISESRRYSKLALSKLPMEMVEGLKGGVVRLPLTLINNAERNELEHILIELNLNLKK